MKKITISTHTAPDHCELETTIDRETRTRLTELHKFYLYMSVAFIVGFLAFCTIVASSL